MDKFVPTSQTQFRTIDQELAFLRSKIAEQKKHSEKIGLNVPIENIARNAISEYKREPAKKILHSDLALNEEQTTTLSENIKLKLSPEEHDKRIDELMHIAKEKGVRNALSVVEKIQDFHVTDDFHRYLAEYLNEGHNTDKKEFFGVSSKDKLYKGINMSLFEVVVPESVEEKGKALRELISSMEQFYAGMLSITSKEAGENYISLEIANAQNSSEVIFYVAVPTNYKSLFEKQILSVFHNAKIIPALDDYNIFNEKGVTLGSVAKLEKNDIFPIKTYESFDHDPLNAILNSFSKVNREGEGGAIQLIWSPAGDYYNSRFKHALDKINKGTSVKEAIDMPESLSSGIFKELKGFLHPSKAKKPGEIENKQIDEVAITEIKKKMESPVVKCNLRILASSVNESDANEIIESLESSFNQFQNTTGNSIKWKRMKKGDLTTLTKNYSFRVFNDDEKLALNLRELTSLIHFNISLIKSHGGLKQSRSATSEAPMELLDEGVLLGVNKHQNRETKVHLATEDRLRHFYTIGQTGTGKSTLLKNMIIQDIVEGRGICMIDPHGSDIMDVLANIPKERYDDVIYFDPAYTERPMALNMLEYDERFPEQKTFVVNELFNIFRKLYGGVPEAMGPAFEQYFRNSALLVMEDPTSGNTLVDVSRVLSDKKYRELKLSRCKNPLVVQFWQNAEKTSGEQGLSNYVQYVTNKFDVFLSNEIMRPVIAQEKSSFNFREIMDNKKILLVNLSKGRLGDINANLIGLILVGKILMAALSRVELFGSSNENDFPAFYLYIDEFQNITTDSIATILSEARKYKLSLNIAHQYISQLEENTKNAVFGNVGSLCAFRVGAEDAEFLEKQFSPTFGAFDLMNVDNRNAYLKMLVNGKPVKPFNVETLAPPMGNRNRVEEIKQLSYSKFGKPRDEVEKLILQKYSVG